MLNFQGVTQMHGSYHADLRWWKDLWPLVVLQKQHFGMECSWRKGRPGNAWRHILGEGTAKRNAMLEDPSKAPPFVASGLRIELNMLDLVGMWPSHGFKSQHPIQLTSTNGQLINNPSIFFLFCPEKNQKIRHQHRPLSNQPIQPLPEVMNRFTVKPGSEPEFEQRWAKRESKLLEAPSGFSHGCSDFFRWSEKGLLFKRLTL